MNTKIVQFRASCNREYEFPPSPPLFSDPDPPPRPRFPAHITLRVRAQIAPLYATLDVAEWDDALAADLIEMIDAYMVEHSHPSIMLRARSLHALAKVVQ